MWRRTYLTLLLIRLYFALSSSYIHPDENFQGPELIVGEVFGYPTQLTWEFTSAEPIRSIFPLWLVYGLPMLLLRWILTGNDKSEEVSPAFVFWTLRVLMFTLSFVMEDWALYELIQSPRHRKVVVVLVASSYVTWTYQTHTFSNSIETLTVAWALVLIQRIVEKRVCNSYTICTSKLSLPQRRSSTFNSVMLGFILALGLFNRVTFPAFLFIPGLQLIPYLFKRPIALSVAMFSLLITSLVAIYLDSSFYTKNEVTWSSILWHPTITPINNIRYNLSRTNLSQHGLHPRYQHILFNLPQLIGPAFILLFRPEKSLRFYSAISGIFLLSFFEHQEARFLLPAVPLLLSSISLPRNKLYLKIWSITWIFFNVIFGILMGVYHQGGIVPTQLYLSKLHEASHALWWKTYSPPIWLLDGKNKSLKTHDLMGIKGSEMLQKLTILATCNQRNNSSQYQETEGTYLILPLSATYLESIIDNQMSQGLHFREIWRYKKHLSLDDLDFGKDGFWPTIKRVVGKRGIIVWKVTKDCCENCE